MASPDGFRTAFPEFLSNTDFPYDTIEFWLDIATETLPASRWGSLFDVGCYLWTAHHLVMSRRDVQAASGGLPGTVKGPLTAQAVDKVSASYDASSVALTGGADFNTTTYGVRFLRLARLMGTGGVQL